MWKLWVLNTTKSKKKKKKSFLALVKREREREPSWYLKQIKTKTFLKLMTVLFCLFFFFLLSAAFVQLSLFFVFLFLSGCELALSDDDKANHSSTRTFQNRIIFTYTNSHTLVQKKKKKTSTSTYYVDVSKPVLPYIPAAASAEWKVKNLKKNSLIENPLQV